MAWKFNPNPNPNMKIGLNVHVCLHVDDAVHCGTTLFYEKVVKPLKSVIQFGTFLNKEFQFVGWNLSHRNGNIVHQHDYILQKLSQISIDPKTKLNKSRELNLEEKKSLRSAVGKARWITDQSRPDCSFEELELSMNVNKATVKDIVTINKMFIKMKQDKVELVFSKLPGKEFYLTVFSYASRANLPDGVSSAMGYIIFLTNGYVLGQEGQCNPLVWKSTKIQRVVSSTLDAETLALLAALEQAIVLKNQLFQILNFPKQAINIQAFVDNKDCVTAIHSSKQTQTSRIRVDLANIKSMLQDKEVFSVSWIEGGHQLADCLTKRGASSVKLTATLCEGTFL